MSEHWRDQKAGPGGRSFAEQADSLVGTLTTLLLESPTLGRLAAEVADDQAGYHVHTWAAVARWEEAYEDAAFQLAVDVLAQVQTRLAEVREGD